MTGASVHDRIDEAFAYRGYVTLSLSDGSRRVGFVYDRGADYVEMFDEPAQQRLRVAIDDITDVALSGEDSAARAREHWERRQGSLEPSATSRWGDWEEPPTMVVVALPMELRGVARALGARVAGDSASGWLGGRVIARAVGVGGSAAPAIAAERPRLVISCGLAGGLHPTLGLGHLVVASSVSDETGDVISARRSVVDIARRSLGGLAPVAVGEIVCVTRVATTREDKRALARQGRVAVDLESWSAARAAERAGVPWLALRIVLDPLDSELPAFTREPGGGSWRSALRHAARGPRSALELAHLALSASIAIRSIERALWRLAPALEELGAAEERA